MYKALQSKGSQYAFEVRPDAPRFLDRNSKTRLVSCYDTRKEILIVSDLTVEFLAFKYMPLPLFVCE